MITSQIHRDQALTNISVAYKNENYIADQVFPKVKVKKDSNEYYIFKRDARIPETLRANRGLAREHTFKMTYGVYYLKEHALKDYISDRDKANHDLGNLRADVTEVLTDKIMLRRENEVAQFFNVTAEASSTWANNASLAAAQKWSSNSQGSDPIIVTDTMGTDVLNACFKNPNTFIMPDPIKKTFKRHVAILDRIKYTSAKVDDMAIAAMIGVGKVHFPSVVYESTKEGASTTTFASLWGDNCWIGYVEPNPGPRKVSAGYTFVGDDFGVRRWYSDERKSEAIEVAERYDPKVVSDYAGALIVDVT